MVEETFACRLAKTECDRERARELMHRIAYERHGCAPPPLPAIIVIAEAESELVGTIALDLGEDEKPLPLELIYEFDRKTTPFPWHRRDFAQIGRWVSTRPGAGVSLRLMHFAVLHALKESRKYCLAEMKKAIRDYSTNTIGMEFFEVRDCRLVLENIPEEGRAYYTEPPPPCLYMLSLQQMDKALRG